MTKRWGSDYFTSADRQTDWLSHLISLYWLVVYQLSIYIYIHRTFSLLSSCLVSLTGAVSGRTCELSNVSLKNFERFFILIFSVSEKEHKASLTRKHVTQRLNHTAQYFSENQNFSGWGFSAALKAPWPPRVSHQLLASSKAGAIFLSLQLARHDFKRIICALASWNHPSGPSYAKPSHRNISAVLTSNRVGTAWRGCVQGAIRKKRNLRKSPCRLQKGSTHWNCHRCHRVCGGGGAGCAEGHAFMCESTKYSK